MSSPRRKKKEQNKLKKLMIAAAIVCAAAFAQAASADWAVNEIGLAGNADDWEIDQFGSSGWKVYVFDSNNENCTSYAAMIAALSGNDFDAISDALDTNIGTGTTMANGAFSIMGTDVVGNPGDMATGYAVILNTLALTKGEGKAFVIAENSAEITGSSLASVTMNNFGDENYEGLIDATGANGRGVWYNIPGDVPEPTSGLLLLLGVAGLALRRRRA